VTVSTFAGELQAATLCLERGILLQSWLTEIFHGAKGGPGGLAVQTPAILMESVMDCKGLFDALTNRDLGKITDKTQVLWVLSYREALRGRLMEKCSWVPTESMLADDLTKAMIVGSGLWPIVFMFAYWQPFSRPELPEDWVTFNVRNGSVTRYRLSDAVLGFLKGASTLEESAQAGP
jgi:hypothetical protein